MMLHLLERLNIFSINPHPYAQFINSNVCRFAYKQIFLRSSPQHKINWHKEVKRPLIINHCPYIFFHNDIRECKININILSRSHSFWQHNFAKHFLKPFIRNKWFLHIYCTNCICKKLNLLHEL